MLPFPTQAPDVIASIRRQIAEQARLTDATKALGLVPCDCGRIAITYLRSATLRFSAPCCPMHRDNVIRSFEDAKLDQRQWDASPLNVDYWREHGNGMLDAETERASAEPIQSAALARGQRMNVAAKVRAEKEAHPERFCAEPRCLWRVITRNGLNPCRNHPTAAPRVAEPRVTAGASE